MPTCTALTLVKNNSSGTRRRYSGLTLTELVVVVAIVSLFIIFPAINLCGLFTRSTFKSQVNEFVSTLGMAVNAAAESDRRYEVIVNLAEQNYTLRQITSTDLTVVFEEDIIVINDFSDSCFASYVEFDDMTYTNEDKAKFRAGRSGWEYGGKIVLLDSDNQAYSVVVSRIGRIVELRKGDVELLRPRPEDEIPFR